MQAYWVLRDLQPDTSYFHEYEDEVMLPEPCRNATEDIPDKVGCLDKSC